VRFYLAHDERLERKIALKLLPAHFTTNQKRMWRFQQEARMASALNHPNIITIHEMVRLRIAASSPLNSSMGRRSAAYETRSTGLPESLKL
jgi:serine/threonine protein kinase